jgi:hypothetical protein
VARHELFREHLALEQCCGASDQRSVGSLDEQIDDARSANSGAIVGSMRSRSARSALLEDSQDRRRSSSTARMPTFRVRNNGVDSRFRGDFRRRVLATTSADDHQPHLI